MTFNIKFSISCGSTTNTILVSIDIPIYVGILVHEVHAHCKHQNDRKVFQICTGYLMTSLQTLYMY